MSREQIEFLKESHRELKHIEDNPNHTLVKKWKDKLLPKLYGTSKIKIKRLEIVYSDNGYTEHYIEEHEFKIAETILRDTAFKYVNKKKVRLIRLPVHSKNPILMLFNSLALIAVVSILPCSINEILRFLSKAAL